jgi:hypothetical protein
VRGRVVECFIDDSASSPCLNETIRVAGKLKAPVCSLLGVEPALLAQLLFFPAR